MNEDAEACELNQMACMRRHMRRRGHAEEYVIRQFHEWVGAELARP